MTLLDQLASPCTWCATVRSVPCPAHGSGNVDPSFAVAKPEKRKRWRRERQTRAVRQAAERKLAEELRARRQEWAAQEAQERAKLAQLSWPEGIRVVETATRTGD